MATEIWFRGSEGGSVLESIRLAAAYCVGYHERFEAGEVTTGAYVCELTLSDPDGFTIHAGSPTAVLVAPVPGEHGTPPLPPATGVKPMGSLALELIKLGLTPAEANYVKLDTHGLVDKKLLHQGASALALVGGNYQALMDIADSGKTVEVIMSPTFETRTTLKPRTMEPVEYVNEFDTLWKIEKENWLKEGHTFEEYKASHSYSHEGVWSGMGGVILVPDDPGGYGPAKGENIQVILNNNYTGGTLRAAHKQMAGTLAHEMYGHVLFKVQGKRWEHGKNPLPGSGSDYNTPLQIQINHRRDEALRNADRHKR